MQRAIVEKEFEYRGYPCKVKLMDLGHRCGYVGIAPGKQFYNIDYDDIPVGCHGGLTYGSLEDRLADHRTTFWIGFDCAHLGDGVDYDAVIHKFTDPETIKFAIEAQRTGIFNRGSEPKSIEFVENECKRIVDQLIELEDDLK